MSAKRQNSLAEMVRNAAVGYAVVVLGIICFLLTLAVVIAGVRMVYGMNSTTATVNNQVAITNSVNESGTA